MSTFANDLQSKPSAYAGQAFPRSGSLGELTLEIVRRLQAASSSSASFDQLLEKIGEITLTYYTNCLDVWICRKADLEDFGNISSLVGRSGELDSLVANEVAELCREVRSSNSPRIASIDFGAPRSLIAVPIQLRHSASDPVELILAGLFESQNFKTNPDWFMVVAGQSISQWVQTRSGTRCEASNRQTAEINRTYVQLAQSTDAGQSARVMVNSIRRLTAAQHVSLTVDGSLVAVSDVEQFDPNAESNQVIRSASLASLNTGSTIIYRSSETAHEGNQLHLQAFCRSHHFEACASIPVFNQDDTAVSLASVLIAGAAAQFEGEPLKSMEEITRALGQQFKLTLQAHRTVGKIAKEGVHNWVHHRWRKVVLGAILGLAVLLAIPMPYRIRCNCEIQSVSRRFIVAPFEGILERSFVRNGDVVKMGQVLAKLDGRLLRIELAGLSAELAGARKRFDSELAAGNIAQSQIAKSEMERLKAKINLFQERTETLEIRSPIDGVVVAGDLEKAEGASLTIGQTLFEIAPLDQMVVEVAIPESEIPYAKSEMEVAIKLNAFPYRTWDGRIETIHPSAEIIDNDSYFVAHVTLPNEDGSLRPGMKGKAKIKSTMATLGWSLLHRPWETCRYWMIW